MQRELSPSRSRRDGAHASKFLLFGELGVSSVGIAGSSSDYRGLVSLDMGFEAKANSVWVVTIKLSLRVFPLCGLVDDMQERIFVIPILALVVITVIRNDCPYVGEVDRLEQG